MLFVKLSVFWCVAFVEKEKSCEEIKKRHKFENDMTELKSEVTKTKQIVKELKGEVT